MNRNLPIFYLPVKNIGGQGAPPPGQTPLQTAGHAREHHCLQTVLILCLVLLRLILWGHNVTSIKADVEDGTCCYDLKWLKIYFSLEKKQNIYAF